MMPEIRRRQFLQLSAASAAAAMLFDNPTAHASMRPTIISPGAVKSKVPVALLFVGKPKAHWPSPDVDIEAETNGYRDFLAKNAAALSDIDFVTDELVTTPERIAELAPKLASADGILVVHVSMGIGDMVKNVLALNKPTVIFAAPYSGHEWNSMGRLMEQPEGRLLDCIFSSDRNELIIALRPFRAIHHLREAKVLNVTSRELPAELCAKIKDRFGTEIVRVDRDRVISVYNSIDEGLAAKDAKALIRRATKVVEPSQDEIVRSCRLASAFEKIVTEEQATAITVDCYGSMYRQLPAFPCVGFTRLNDAGLAGICESDLSSAVTFMMMQALSGRPGFISDPTVDEADGTIILAHCLGSTKMDGPDGHACPYKIRSIMERQEGAVMQVKMDTDQPVTQGILVNMDTYRYFTGVIDSAPDVDRGCRTKIAVRVDGDVRTLWQNWQAGLHRVTTYGNLTADLKRFCRFKDITMIDEAISAPAIA